MDMTQRELKRRAAEQAVDFVQNGFIVGLGTGSTAYFAIKALGRRIAGGLRIKGVPTSIATEKIAIDSGIPIVSLNEVDSIDVVIDGADEIDMEFNMIKGGGGALTREKVVALAAKKRIIVIDESKVVSRLGDSFLLPVETLPFAWKQVSVKLESLACLPSLRKQGDEIFVTDNGNYIVDCKYNGIYDAADLERQIKLISGVIESGLFVGIADILVVGLSNAVEVRFRPR